MDVQILVVVGTTYGGGGGGENQIREGSTSRNTMTQIPPVEAIEPFNS